MTVIGALPTQMHTHESTITHRYTLPHTRLGVIIGMGLCACVCVCVVYSENRT